MLKIKENLSNPYKIQKVTGEFYFNNEYLNNTGNYVCYFKIGKRSSRDLCSYTIEKPKNVIRIIALGDSFTYGIYLFSNESWPKLLEKKLNAVQSNYSYQVFNFGIPGLGSNKEVNLLYSEGLNYNPGIVILHYICNDLIPQEIIDNPNKTEVENWFNTHDYTLIFKKEVETNFKNLADIAQKNNIKILIMFDPSWDVFHCKDYQLQKVKQISREYDWGFLDLSPFLEKYHRQKILLNESMHHHPNLLGYEIRANVIFDYLLSNAHLDK